MTARALRITHRAQRELSQLAPRGSLAWRFVARALYALTEEPSLPGPADSIVQLPYSVPARHVPEANLKICYVPSHDEVSVVALVKIG